jgi:hypothetical protein
MKIYQYLHIFINIFYFLKILAVFIGAALQSVHRPKAADTLYPGGMQKRTESTYGGEQ